MALLLCTLVVSEEGNLVSVDLMICKPVRAGLADRMPLTQLI